MTDTTTLTSSQKSIFVRCFYTFFVNGTLALMLGAILPFMRETYHLDYMIAGMLLSVHSVGNLTSSLIGGILPAYLGRKKSILLLSSGGIIAFILMIITKNPLLLLLAFFLSGINRGAVSNFNNTMVNEIATGKAWALNLLHSVFALGAFASPFIALFFVRNNPNGWIYAALTLAVLCISEVLVYLFMDIPNDRIEKKEKKPLSLAFFKDKYYVTTCIILFFYLCAEQAFNGWLVTYFKESGILNATLAQSMTSLLWIVILVGRLTTAYLSSKIKKPTLLLINAAGYLIFFLLLIVSRTLWPVIIGIVGVGFFMAGIYPTAISSTGKIVKEYPLALSCLLTIAGLGAIIMPSIIGAVANQVGIIGGMSTVTVVVVVAFLLIVFNAFLNRNRPQE